MKIPTPLSTEQSLRTEIAEMRARLEEAEETLRAIRAGEVELLVVEGDRDVMGRKQVEGALRESEERLRLAIAGSDLGTWHWDLRTKTLDWSERCLAIFGIPPRTAMSYEKFLGALHPEDRARADDAVQRALQDGSEYRIEFRSVRPDGSVHWAVSLGRAYYDAAGVPTRMEGIAFDITERKRAEEALRESERQYRALALASSEVAYRLSADWSTLLPVEGRELVASSDEPLADWAWLDQNIPPEEHPRVRQAISEAIAGKSLFELEHRVRRPDGSIGWTLSRAVPILDENGEVTEWLGAASDITVRKQADQMLAERTELLNRVLESTTDVIFVKDLHGRMVLANAAFGAAASSTPEQLVGKTDEDWFPPDVAAAVRQQDEAVIAGGSPLQFEETVPVAGEARTFLTLKAPLRDGGGRIVGLFGIGRDITERKLAENALRENAAVFSTLIAQAPMGTYVVDAEFRMRQINAEALPAFATVEPLIGRDFHEVLEIVWGPDLGGQLADIFRHTLATGEPYISPPFTEMRHDLGIQQAYEWQTQRVTLPDGAMGVVCYFHEVTERARATEALRVSQERMRLAAEATGVGFWEWNVVTNAIHWDAVMFAMYGITPTPDGLVQYSDWSGSVLPEDLAENEAILQDTVRRCGRSTRSFGIRRRNDGECRHIEAVETVRVDAAGQAAIVVGTNLDVTAQKNAEEAMEESARHKDHFLATLAHELRNPLAPLKNGLQLMELAPDDLKAMETTRAMMVRQLDHMVRLVDDLMDLSRINRGKLDLVKADIELRHVVATALEASKPLIERQGHQLSVELTADALMVHGDADRLTQVVSNLLNNSAKYTPAGGRIDLWVGVEKEEAVLRVKDNGIGVDPVAIANVFDMFAQVESSSKGLSGRGLGIGLNIVRRLVRMHGGEVEGHSEGHGKGSEFVVRLPLLKVVQKLEPVQRATSTPSASRRILVVDDNEDVALSMSMVLKLFGHVVAVASDGIHAVSMAASFEPDVILMDIGMPRMNGYEACAAIRATEHGKRVHIIAVSGWGQEEDRSKSRDAGFDGHVVKPVDKATLERVIAEAQPHRAV